MRVVFLGDVAIDVDVNVDVSFDSELVIANLEGAISSQNHLNERVVYNDPVAIEFLKKTGVNAVGLANNHLFDLGHDIEPTIELLEKENIECFGAGTNIEFASRPLVSGNEGTEVVVFGAGWSVIGCRSANREKAGVVPLAPERLFLLLEETLIKKPDAKVVFYLHWNYELELYPQPAHRKLAFDLVHSGAAAVIGAHSHCVQGVERVGNGFVAHGLGNWMFPHNRFFNGKLAFPDFACDQFACHFDPRESNHRIGWYRFEDNCSIRKVNEMSIDSSQLDRFTPYRGMSHKEYTTWFRVNRRKKKLLPVYVDYSHHYRNFLKDCFVRSRQFFLDKSVEYGLKGAPK